MKNYHNSILIFSYFFPFKSLCRHVYALCKIRKYGFHGTSHRYVDQRVAELIGENKENLKVINCHLGQGASICAINGYILSYFISLTFKSKNRPLVSHIISIFNIFIIN